MGLDWHAYVERQVDGQWVPNWQPMVNSLWWFQYILAKKIEDGSIRLLLPKSTNLFSDGTRLFRDIPINKAESEYGHHPLVRHWFEAVYPKDWQIICKSNGLDVSVDEYPDFRLETRDYKWFKLLGYVHNAQDTRDMWRYPIDFTIQYLMKVPEDMSRTLQQEWNELGGEDAFMRGYIELPYLFVELDRLRSKGTLTNVPPQEAWLRSMVDEPDQCRLVFWFY